MSEPPFGNHFLDTLQPAARARLTPSLKRVTLPVGQVLVEQDHAFTAVHFPITCQLANTTLLADGASIETSVIGREGVSGLAPFMADAHSPWRIFVRAAGDAWTIESRLLRAVAADDPELLKKLLTLTHFYQAQAAQSAACNARHGSLPRLARWLLTASDLTPGLPLMFKQEEMGLLLGTQRSTIVEAATQLKALRAIRYGRGVIRIDDRAALLDMACECYGALHKIAAEADLLPPGAPSSGALASR